jgi:hypothetical protein
VTRSDLKVQFVAALLRLTEPRAVAGWKIKARSKSNGVLIGNALQFF